MLQKPGWYGLSKKNNRCNYGSLNRFIRCARNDIIVCENRISTIFDRSGQKNQHNRLSQIDVMT